MSEDQQPGQLETTEPVNKGGRPTLFTEETVGRAEKYLENFRESKDVIPTIEGFAAYIGTARPTVYLWVQKINEEGPKNAEEAELFTRFIDSYKNVLDTRSRMLQNLGLNGTFNPTITKLLLSNHGYVEKSEQDVTSKGEKVGVIVSPSQLPDPRKTDDVQVGSESKASPGTPAT